MKKEKDMHPCYACNGHGNFPDKDEDSDLALTCEICNGFGEIDWITYAKQEQCIVDRIGEEKCRFGKRDLPYKKL